MKAKTHVNIAALMVCGLFCAGTGVAQSNSLMASNSPSGSSTPARNNGHAASASSIPPVHDFSIDVRDGILTVDGMVGKAQLNYHIKQGFLYFTVPGVGTAIVAQTRFMNAAQQKGAFRGNDLIINVNGHTVELSDANPLVSGKGADAWVAIDPLYGASMFPQMGFGDTQQRPYVWPGSEPEHVDKNAYVTPPPLPAALRPKPQVASSYSVTVPASVPGR